VRTTKLITFAALWAASSTLSAGCRCGGNLSGLGPELVVIEPTAKENPTTFIADFGTVEAGSYLAKVTVENRGTAVGRLTQIEFGPGTDAAFKLGGGVPVPLPIERAGSGTFDILFNPSHAGSSSGTVEVDTDDPKLPHFTVKLLGLVTASQVQVCVETANGSGTFTCNSIENAALTIDFGAHQVGAPAVKRRAQVRSIGNKALDYYGTAFDPGSSPLFGTEPNQAPGATATTLQPMTTHEFEFTYTPATAGPAEGLAYVNTNDLQYDSIPVRLLARAAVSTVCHLVAAPGTVDFGAVPNNQMADQGVVVVNDGLQPCDVSSLALTGSSAFTLTTPPSTPMTMMPNDVMTFGVHYVAAGTTSHMGDITIVSNDPARPMLVIPVRASSIDPPPCVLVATPSNLDFGGVAVGDRSLRSVRLSAMGSDICLVNGASIRNGNSHFIAGNVPAFPPLIVMAGTGLPGLGAPEVGVTYAPTVSRNDADVLEIRYTAGFTGPSLKLAVPLTARAGSRSLCVVPNRLHFGPVPNGTQKDLSFTMTACGGAPVAVNNLTVEPGGSPFSLANAPALPLNLAAAASANQVVRLSSNGMSLTGRVKIESSDPVFPVQYVDLDTGPELVSPDAGEVLYSWTAGVFGGGGVGMNGSVYVTRLQGPPNRRAFYGSDNGQACSGCHAASPDGKYVALVEFGSQPTMRIIDARTGGSVPVAGTSDGEFPSWNPNVNTNPPYQFVYAAGGKILKVASVAGGVLREVQGANLTAKVQTQPTWGPNGTIAFVRGDPADAGSFEIVGPCDLVTVPEGGGAVTAVAGASGNGGSNYFPEYSPNGKYIAYTFSPMGSTTRSASDSVIKLVDTTSGQVLSLPQLNAQIPNSWPTWARDGSFLSFSSTRGGGAGSADIYFAPVSQVTGVDGPAQPLTLVNTPNFDHIARWAFLPPP